MPIRTETQQLFTPLSEAPLKFSDKLECFWNEYLVVIFSQWCVDSNALAGCLGTELSSCHFRYLPGCLLGKYPRIQVKP